MLINKDKKTAKDINTDKMDAEIKILQNDILLGGKKIVGEVEHSSTIREFSPTETTTETETTSPGGDLECSNLQNCLQVLDQQGFLTKQGSEREARTLLNTKWQMWNQDWNQALKSAIEVIEKGKDDLSSPWYEN